MGSCISVLSGKVRELQVTANRLSCVILAATDPPRAMEPDDFSEVPPSTPLPPIPPPPATVDVRARSKGSLELCVFVFVVGIIVGHRCPRRFS